MYSFECVFIKGVSSPFCGRARYTVNVYALLEHVCVHLAERVKGNKEDEM